jgi:beta-galactosidase
MVLTNPLDEQGSPDDWKMAQAVEVWGTSLYPRHVGAKETKHAFFRAAMLTSTRSACDSVGAPYWLGELQAGHGYVGMFASHMTAQDARQYLLQPLAHGAKGLCFYAWYPMSSGYESAGFGMANLDGSPSDRALAAGKLVQKISPDMQLFYRAKPVRAEVAVCLNNYSNIMWQCMRQPWHYIPSRSYVGAYKAVHQKHLPADYIHPDEISQGKLEKYRVLYLPFAFMLPRQAAAQIGKFVEQGGIVLAEARTAWNDETGYCGDAVPGFGLEKVFGCREKGAEGVGEDAPVSVRIVQAHPTLPTLQVGDQLQGAFFREALELLSPDTEVLAVFEDGSPAIVVHRYGQGWAMFVGTMLSLGYYKFDDRNTGKLLQGLLDLAPIDPPVQLQNVPEDVEIEPRLLEFQDEHGKSGYLFFAFNHSESNGASETMQPFMFGLRIPSGNYVVNDVIHEQTVSATWSDERLHLQTNLAPGEIWLVKILAA